jgi:hypothetical protein
LGAIFNANAHDTREGYSLSNADHLRRVDDDQFQACVAAIKGVTVSPLTPSWIDASSGKGARLDHLVGLGVEFTCTSGVAVWVGTPFHDHARVSFAVKLGTPKAKIKNADRLAWYQKMTLKQWQGISHQIDDPLRSLANQSLERLKGGGGDADLERRKMIEARIRAAEMVKQDIPKEHKTRMPFRNTLEQTLLRKRSTMEADLQEAHTHTHIQTHIHTPTRMHARTHTHTLHARTHTHTLHARTHTHAHVCMHARTHTHT